MRSSYIALLKGTAALTYSAKSLSSGLLKVNGKTQHFTHNLYEEINLNDMSKYGTMISLFLNL